MSDTPQTPREPEETPDAEVSLEDGVSEAGAEASIAALVEAERETQAEEAAVAEAEAAEEREEPADAEPEAVAEPEPAPAPAKKAPAAAKKTAQPKPLALAVLGSPIAHSKSPALQKAAYGVLGLDWSYEPIEVTEDALADFVDGLGEEWRGLSLTMPLKKAVLPLLTEIDRVAEQTGAANTVLFDGESVRGFNTDVAGIVRALAGAGVTSAHHVHILGGGATAASALVAAAELGAERVDVHVRDLTRSVWLEPLAHELGLMVRLRSLAQADRSLDIPELVISTLPGGTRPEVLYTDSTRRRAVLLDVAYEPWPTPLASAWGAVGGTVVSGLSMLVHQALLQVRIFVSGDPLEPLADEDAVLAAMLDAVGIDAAGVPLEA
ncbi:shikimate dehydrogenase [Leifsonia naganoensis]|uniref:Shikimate dehydrogenase n=1 Tax=Leifsonia naganoensis TaxID=150025 RepID=A0A853DWN1_9MICO|nr:shikimate dehydrogenase [Leifsonia naganoensis]NYK11594.1 shikimate dehydrogenase [Leifsonia naganoensis]